jgi:hypothetical protein
VTEALACARHSPPAIPIAPLQLPRRRSRFETKQFGIQSLGHLLLSAYFVHPYTVTAEFAPVGRMQPLGTPNMPP